MKIELEEPFKSLWRKGYLRQCKKTGRRRVDLKNSKIERTTISYARYLKCVELGYIISQEFEVDHVSRDCSDDSKGNLQILSIQDHLEKTKKELKTGRSILELICPYCGINFQREIRNIKPNSLPKCSRRCNALYNRQFHNWKNTP